MFRSICKCISTQEKMEIYIVLSTDKPAVFDKASEYHVVDNVISKPPDLKEVKSINEELSNN